MQVYWDNDLEFKEKIGFGGFGEVFRAKLKNTPEIANKYKQNINEELAVKILKSDLSFPGDSNAFSEFAKELTNHPKLDNPFLLKLKGYSVQNGKLMLVTTFMPNKSLYDNNKGKIF